MENKHLSIFQIYPILSDHCMVNFVKPNLLGTRKEFGNRFVNPITNGQCTDSTVSDVKLMKRRAHVLHEMLAGCVQASDSFSRSHCDPSSAARKYVFGMTKHA